MEKITGNVLVKGNTITTDYLHIWGLLLQYVDEHPSYIYKRQLDYTLLFTNGGVSQFVDEFVTWCNQTQHEVVAVC